MKLRLAALFAMILSVTLLSACMQQRNSYEQDLMATNREAVLVNPTNYASTKAKAKAHVAHRRHFERGEQVGDELPFTSGQKMNPQAQHSPNQNNTPNNKDASVEKVPLT